MGSNGGPEPGASGRQAEARVAIIEDNREIADLYVMLVKAMEMHLCFVAYDGEAGVAAFREAAVPPEIVLIDHRMPVKSGLDAMREMLALRPGARFIFISADEAMKAEAFAAGATAFLTKPVGLREIADAMKEALARKS